LIADVMDEFGRLDVLINNAGVTPRADLLRVDEWDWQRTLDVNLSGPMYLMQAGVQAMQPEGGVIINIAGELPGEHAWPQQAGYYASKAGLAALTQAAAPELLQHNVRMYAVCPEDTQAGSGPVDESSYLPVTQLALDLCRLTDAGPVGQVLHPGSIDRHRNWTRI
jgi:NAD(P)-dependent dehydrogenase (short-subunit alcohol dehydrogenase family)